MKGLSPEQIAAVMGKGRTQKGFYGVALVEFINSDEAAINPRETWPAELGEKTTSTIYQGFRNAAAAAKIDIGPGGVLAISQMDDSVFILHNERVQLVQAAQAEAEATEDTTDEVVTDDENPTLATPSEVTTTVTELVAA